VVGRYVAYGQDDELSIALMAFVEAIRSYDVSKAISFPSPRMLLKEEL